jgi:hypothetical protein
VVEVLVENTFQIMVQMVDRVVAEEELQVPLIHLEELELQVKEIMVEMVIGLVLEQQQVVVAEVLEELVLMLQIILEVKVDKDKVMV